jgi:hypothetical protein
MVAEVITTDLLINFSVILIILAVIVIGVSLFIFYRKTNEEKFASEILVRLKDMEHKGVVQSNVSLEIQPHETSLKDRLKKKFQPKIESQLNTKVNIIDFNAKGQDFLSLVDVSGIRILLTLDSSGKIIDYKKINPSA